MKVRQRTICQNCRNRKIGCDAKKPSCSQCLVRHIPCPGYSTDWIFVLHTDQKGRKNKTRSATPNRTETTAGIPAQAGMLLGKNSPELSAHSGGSPLDDLITTIIQNYVPETEIAKAVNGSESTPRICGAWVEVLPELVESDTGTALSSAIKAFAVSIQSRGPKHSAPISAALEAYSLALSSVNDALQIPYAAFPIELGAAVMCLLFADLFLSTSLDSWMAHLQGLADLIQLSRPEFYASGIAHRLFVGARPALVVLAFLSKKSCFLAAEDWRRVPFSTIYPSPVQALMNEAAGISSILETLDAAGPSRHVAAEALYDFRTTLGRLDAWADALESSAASPLFWFEPSPEGKRQYIWFQDITVANALTHFWAFKVICLGNIDRLRTSFLGSGSVSRMTHFEEVKGLSIMICQSTEYLMQGEMRLFGPTSVILPLRTAYETFEAGGDQSREEREWCKGIFSDILARGHQFMSLFLDVESGPERQNGHAKLWSGG